MRTGFWAPLASHVAHARVRRWLRTRARSNGPTPPMLMGLRVNAYARQNGTRRLTPAQSRRVRHKANRALRSEQ